MNREKGGLAGESRAYLFEVFNSVINLRFLDCSLSLFFLFFQEKEKKRKKEMTNCMERND